MRFYVDEDLPPRIAHLGRDAGLDIVSSHEVGMNGDSDTEQLEYAAREDRCTVTVNSRDFRGLTEAFFAANRPHAGVICVPPTWDRGDARRIVRAIVEYAERRGDAPNDYLFDYLR